MFLFLLKSIIAVVMVAFSIFAMFTMFEIYGRHEKKFNIERMRKMHKLGGVIFFVLFAFVAYFCLSFIILTKAELSARSTFHSIFALMILVLFGLKIVYTRIYRQFYEHVKVIGLLMALFTFGLAGTSAGYYLLVSEFGTVSSFDNILQYKKRLAMTTSEGEKEVEKYSVETDPESIGRGKNLFDSKCVFCHYANSTETIVGPGLKGILKNRKLPVSKRPANPENIIRQMKQPYNRMPAFDYLTEEEISDIISYLNTL